MSALAEPTLPTAVRWRFLPPSEWPTRLAGTELESIWPHLDRVKARVIVVEHGSKLAASWSLFPLVHAEGISVAPEYRGHAGVGRCLLKGLRVAAEDFHAKTILTAALDDQIVDYIHRLGGSELPGRHFVLTV